MGATRWFAIILLFLVPLGFWLALTAIAQRGRRWVFSAVVTGHDGRLSLSRLQAFAWTMLIAGAYCAAMAVHPRITISSTAERTALEKTATEAAAKLTAAETALRAKEADAFSKKVDAEAAAERVKTAQKRLESARKLAATPADPRLTAEQQAAVAKSRQDAVKAATDAVTAAIVASDQAFDAYQQVALAVRLAKRDRDLAKGDEGAAKTAWRSTQWVRIPYELLALAGISLATGVFAGVISANSDDTASTAPPAIAETVASGTTLTINGANFGAKTGEVRVNGRAVPIAAWADQQITVTIDPKVKPKQLIVDTTNGKDARALNADWSAGEPVSVLEWRDLLREDTNPAKFSMTKFQMLGWTAIALFFFLVILLRNLTPAIDALPTVDATVVLLTGLSHGGYLGGKVAKT